MSMPWQHMQPVEVGICCLTGLSCSHSCCAQLSRLCAVSLWILAAHDMQFTSHRTQRNPGLASTLLYIHYYSGCRSRWMLPSGPSGCPLMLFIASIDTRLVKSCVGVVTAYVQEIQDHTGRPTACCCRCLSVTFATACWVLQKLHPVSAAHWESFNEQVR